MGSVVGIDEAGRGPVLGPMVVAAVEWSENLTDSIKSRGLPLNDSKKLASEDRIKSAQFIRDNTRIRVSSIPAWVFSAKKVTIPQLEARVITAVLRNIEPSRVLSDALGNGTKAHQWIRNHWPDRSFVFESGADETYPAVSAASIIAKVARDRAIEVLKKEWGELGSGYPSDPSTRSWLNDWNQSNDHWPAFVRTDWGTLNRLEST